MNEQNEFKYSYQAPSIEEQKEIRNIKNRYTDLSEQEQKKLKLKKLDWKVSKIPFIIALSIGIVSILLFGLGLTCILEWHQWLIGLVCSISGCFMMIFNYRIYQIIYLHLKKKYKDEIISLADDLLK